MLTDGTGKAPEQVLSKAIVKNKDQDVRAQRQTNRQTEKMGRA